MSTEKNKRPIMSKRTVLIIAAAVLGLILLIVPGAISEKEDEPPAQKDVGITYYTETVEKKLTKLLLSVKGIESASVVVTLDRSEELVYAQNETKSQNQSAAEYVIISAAGGEEAVLVTEIYPKVRGVAVVCSGGDDPAVKERVIALVCASLGISSNKVAVSG